MNTHFSKFSAALLSLSVMSLLAVVFIQNTPSANFTAQSTCVGKPYGYPGCPTRPAPSTLSSSSSTGYCGNAILEGTEECDRGRFNGKTDCSVDCKNLVCGDGLVSKDIGEECEPTTEEVYVQDKNGNLTTEIRFVGNNSCGWYCQPPVCDDKGSCKGGCNLQYIGQCTASGSQAGVSSEAGTSSIAPAVTGPTCGNAVQEVGEECDDGNKNPVDACTNDCTVPRCGDSILQKDEECDDGNADNADSCTNACKLPRCGDSIRQAREECDDGQRNSDSLPGACRSNCLLAYCGDGVVDKGEQCDADGGNSNTTPNACRTSCKVASCGDGVTDAGEECDDGNRSDTDTCTNTCKRPSCGDSIVHAGEECDWGSLNSDTKPDACRRLCRRPRCGDGIVDTGEKCDGGNNCTVTCTLVDTTAISTTTASSSKATSSASIRKPLLRTSAPEDTTGLGGLADMLPAILAASGALLILSALLFRRRIVGLFSGKGAKSLDDIPLDQIEMPWHKW